LRAAATALAAELDQAGGSAAG
ncbi:MAG: hypothetical protein QOD96_6905, partial [Pseudonocardiales bacterium]|nr:hypothetical protein [Pseudonocardiales bacterium]